MNLINWLDQTTWAITPGKLETIVDVLRSHAEGRLSGTNELRAALIEEQREAEATYTDGTDAAGNRVRFNLVGDVAMISCMGTLMHRAGGLMAMSGATSYQRIRQQCEAAHQNGACRRILLEIDSPGGEARGLDDLGAFLRDLRGSIDIQAHISGLGCSAAYHLASAANHITMSADALAGSIGVIMSHVDRSARNAADGFVVTYITAGEEKADGNRDEPLSERAAGTYQGIVDDLYGRFVASVAAGRRVSEATVLENMADARVFTSDAALEAGLVDAIGPVTDVTGQAALPMRSQMGPAAAFDVNRLQLSLAASLVRAGIPADDAITASAAAVARLS